MTEDVIKVKHTSIEIPNYEIGDNPIIEKRLSIWNKSYFQYDPIGISYDEDNRLLKIPRGLDLNYVEKSFNKTLDIDYTPDPYDKAHIKLLVPPRSDLQRKSISFLLGEDGFEYTKNYSQLSLNLDTGDGKTYCVIAALTFIRTKSLIITHINRIKNQWKTSLLKMTDLDERDILDIASSSTIDKLLKYKGKIPYKVFLVNHRTLNMYAKKHGWDKISELFKTLKIGVKVFDEAHIEFENLVQVDLNTNTKKTFYLTANFERSEHRENTLFNLCFKNIAKFGGDKDDKSSKRKHIIYIGYLYNTKPTMKNELSIKNIHGFDKNKYIDYEIQQEKFFECIYDLIDRFKDTEGKILIMLSKIDACNILAKDLEKTYPEIDIGIYHSKIPDVEKVECLDKKIIISTSKSLGTGVDIHQLRYVIMTEQYSSKIIANQAAGRLREFSPEDNTFYIEVVDIGFNTVRTMYKNRLSVFKQKCLKVLEYKI